MKMKKEAFILFGGVASGKTTFSEALESTGAVIVATDRLLYEADSEKQRGGSSDSHKKREILIGSNDGRILVFDEMAKGNLLKPISERGYSLSAVFINLSSEERKRRFHKRRKGIFSDYFKIVNAFCLCSDEEKKAMFLSLSVELAQALHLSTSEKDEYSLSQSQMREIHSSQEFHKVAPKGFKEVYDSVVRGIYLGGSQFFREDVPDPLNESGISNVICFGDDDNLRQISKESLDLLKIPFRRYSNERSGRPIKLAIWDIGGVIYNYSVIPLFELVREYSPHDDTKEKFSFDSYMRGELDDQEFCRCFCERFDLPCKGWMFDKVLDALEMGIGRFNKEVVTSILNLKAKGVRNAVLSNALPALRGSMNTFHGIIPDEDIYTSYDIGALKPESKAFQAVLNGTGIPADDAIMIDDRSRNVIGAIDVGISGIKYKKGALDSGMRYNCFNSFK